MVHQRFRDLPASLFPLVVSFEAHGGPRGAEPLWREIVTGPGALEVPAAGRPVRTRVIYGDGTAECIEATGERRFYRRLRLTSARSGLVTLQIVDLVRPSHAAGRVLQPGPLGLPADEELVYAELEEQLEPSSFVCPTCRRTSHNLGDVENRYCGACHRFVNPPG